MERAADTSRRQRVPLVLYHMKTCNMTRLREIGVSMGKVKTDIFRGREALRRKLILTLAAKNWRGQYESAHEKQLETAISRELKALPTCARLVRWPPG